MGVRRRGNKVYNISIYLGRGKNGKKDYYYETFYGNKTDAKAREAELKKELKSRKGPRSATMTVEEYLRYWLSNIKNNVERNTLNTYSWHVDKLIPLIGEYPLYAVQVTDLQNDLQILSDLLAHKSVKGIYTTLRTAFRQALAWGILATDLTAGLRTPRKPRVEQEVLNKEELEKLLGALKGYKHHVPLRLTAVTGARISEILGLQWKDINFKKGTVTIRRAVDIIKREVKDTTKTTASQRTIVLDDETIAVLKTHKEAQKKNTVSPLNKRDALVFCTNEGRVLRYGSLSKTLKLALKKAGVKRITIHGLRHTVASILIEEGVSLSTVAALLGHSSPATTADIYVHLLQGGDSVISVMENNVK
ncbi:MAG: tyrosine-type recombinase/integrase [Syntrophaceticus sp.]